MSHPVLWPTTYFYPIGNSPAVCLTENIPPENAVNVLLLGCGDPRNIFFTLHADPPARRPSLDFTCCDIEPGVIARNVLLFTLIHDGHESDRLWNIFYHIRLDNDSFSLLISQVQKLLEHTSDLASWEKSPYSWFLRFCSRHTLSQLHHYLGLYGQAGGYSKVKHKQLFDSFTRQFEAQVGSKDIIFDFASAAGPFAMQVVAMTNDHMHQYWKTGIVSRSTADISAATFINPTFVHSESCATALTGDRCTLHYGAYPLQGFHLASAFLLGGQITEGRLISCAQSEFRQWCRTFRGSTSSPQKSVTIRLLIGDALAFCPTLSQIRSTVVEQLYVSPWKATDLVLDGSDYEPTGNAPTSFNVIDTSNVADHVGLLNILIAAVPLLAQDPVSTLYTELKLTKGEDTFTRVLCAEVPTIGLLLGIIPTATIAQFTSDSNGSRYFKGPSRERIRWKVPCTVDVHAANGKVAPITPSFQDSSGLADILFKIYIQMFPEEQGSPMPVGAPLYKVHYTRGTFAALLGLIKARVQANWTMVVNRIIDLVDADRKLITGSNYYQELCCQLHLQGVHSVETLGPRRETINHVDWRGGVFKGWNDVPPVICLVLVVPRNSIRVLENRSAAGKLGSPILQCGIRGRGFHTRYSCIQVVLGTASIRGTGQDCEVSITEDPAGWSGKSSLIVSTLVPVFNLLHDTAGTRISLGLHPTQDSLSLMGVLGLYLNLFTADITDKQSVHVTLNRPNRSSPVSAATIPPVSLHTQASVGLIDTQMSTLTVRCELNPGKLGEGVDLRGAKVAHAQISLCIIQLVINDLLRKNLVYPFPVDGTRAKVRIARKSGWIEIEAPIRQCTHLAPADLSDTSILIKDHCPVVWNIHRIDVESLPVLDLMHLDRLIASTLEAHLNLTMSGREWALVKQKKMNKTDLLARVKDTIMQLFMGVIGPNKVRVFVFSNPGNRGIDTILHINGVRMDLASDAFVLDVDVLPVTEDALKGPLGSKIRSLSEEPETATASMAITGADEVIAWKHLLVAFTERCRSWNHTSTCKYAISGKIPVSVEMFQNPLCGCGEGISLGGLSSDPQWKDLAPLMTRAVMSPLFSVAYLETADEQLNTGGWTNQAAATGSDDSKKRCAACHKPEPMDSKLLKCGRCKEVAYCGKACQSGDWKVHKKVCKTK